MIKVSKEEHEAIAAKVMKGNTLQSVGDEYGVTRERIRQIALSLGVSARGAKRLQRQRMIKEHSEVIISARENWEPARFSDYPFTRIQFEKVLAEIDADLYDRWCSAALNPISLKGIADPRGRVCAMCKERKPWSQFYADKDGINGKAQRCIPCAREQVEHYRLLRHVPEPTVEHKICTRCRIDKAAGEYSRSTSHFTGLQPWCNACHVRYTRKRRMEMLRKDLGR